MLTFFRALQGLPFCFKSHLTSEAVLSSFSFLIGPRGFPIFWRDLPDRLLTTEFMSYLYSGSRPEG